MPKIRVLTFAIISAAATLLASTTFAQTTTPAPRGFDYWQPDWMVRELWGPGHMPKSMMVRLLRHQTYMQFGVPKEYTGAAARDNSRTPAAVASGRDLFAKNCASCHGIDGLGGGQTENSLTPSPALLAFMITRPISVDEYLLWSISDGGKEFGSAMPAFKQLLTQDDIWQLIAYMRAGFPQPDEAAKARKQE